MPWLRRLFDSRADEESVAGPGRAARKDSVYLGHRLLQPVSLLHEHVRHSFDSRSRAGGGNGFEGGSARTYLSG